MAKKITRNTTVYSAAAWWRDNDPSMQVVALDARTAKKLIGELIDEAAERAYDDESYDSVEEAQDAIAWSGVHAFALGDLAKGRELAEAIPDLEDRGYWYAPTP